MFTDMTKRAYKQKKRAVSQEATRARIVEALMQLHEEMGPRNATISAIAERAGVQRLTVYRHFPDEAAMFRACTSRWLEINPPPDPAAWESAGGPSARTRAALTVLYRYYRTTRRMWTVSLRDEEAVPALAEPLAAFRQYLSAIRDDLAEAWRHGGSDTSAVTVALGHLVQFETWRSLADLGCDDTRAAALATSWVEAAVVFPESEPGG